MTPPTVSSLQDLAQFTVFCPKVGRPERPEQVHAATCSRRSGCRYASGGVQDLSRTCPSPFRGQAVTASLLPTMPFVLLPHQHGRMAGYVYNLFMYHAEFLRFKPTIFFNSLGKYIPANDSFTPGIHNDVGARAIYLFFFLNKYSLGIAPNNTQCIVTLMDHIDPNISRTYYVLSCM